MLVTEPGERQRTEAEFREMLGGAGFRLTRVIPRASDTNILECAPAQSPIRMGAEDQAGLIPSGEVDGTIPAQLVASLAPQVAAPAPPPPAAAAPAVADKLVGNYNVNYGAQSQVTITGGDGGYTVTAKGPLHWKVPVNTPPGTPTCDLPDETVVATFSAQPNQPTFPYGGQHGTWDKTCQFLGWATLELQLKGTLLTGIYNWPTGGQPAVTFSPA